MTLFVRITLYFLRPILFVIIIFSTNTNCLSQKFKDIGFEHIGIDDGLISNKIFDVKQDKQGFVWIATYNGLDRFDGNKIVHYFSLPNDSTSLPVSLIKKLIIDNENNLWIITNSSYLVKYNRDYDNFNTLFFDNINESDDPVIISGVCDGLHNTLWIATLNNGLIKFNTKNGSIENISIPEYDDLPIYNIYKAKEYLYLDMGDPSSLLKFNLQTNGVDFVKLSETPSEKVANFFSKSIYLDSTGVLWVGTVGKGLCRMEGDKLEWYYKDNGKLSGNIVTSILDYDKDYLWVSTDDGGISILDKKGNLIQIFLEEEENIFSLSVNNIENLFKDRQNIIWVSTYGGGINRYDPNRYLFSKVAKTSYNSKTLNNDNILSFFEDSEGDIWIGTDGGGINKLIQPGHYEHYLYDKNELNSVSGNVITNLQEDNSGQLWISTFGKGVSIYNKKTKQFARHNTSSNVELRNNTVWDILKDRDGDIWLGMEEGNIARYNSALGKYEYLKNDSPDKKMLYSRSLFEDSEGVLWCTFINNGLWKVDKEKMTIEKINLGELNFLSINHMIEDSENRIWMATERFGLVELIKYNDQISIKIMPLLDDQIDFLFLRAIVEDDEGYLWLSSDKGIFKFDKNTLKAEHFTLENGLHGNQFSFGTCLKSKDGTIYFGGSNGYSYFKPSTIDNKENIENIKITKFTIFDHEVPISPEGVLKQSISETKEITLNHNQTTIGFEFSELNFTGVSKKHYCFILEGFDKEWSTNRTVNSVRYTNLSPGNYTFIVKSSKDQQCIDSNATSLSIVVLPPWWLTWWFRTLMVLVVGFAIWVVIIYRTSKLNRQKRELEIEISKRTAKIIEQNEELIASNDQLVDTMNRLETAQDKLVEAEKMASLGVLTAGIAHEIKNPLNFVYAGANSLKENFGSVQEIINAYDALENKNNEIVRIEEIKKEIQFEKLMHIIVRTIANIKEGAERVSEIVKGLSIFSSKSDEIFVKSNVHENLDRTLVLLKHKYLEKVVIEKNYGDVPLIDCYPSKLEQVFINVISNASDAIIKKGKVVIATEVANKDAKEYVCISINDNGQGMDEQVKKRIFEPFYTTKEVGSGTGLGLSISHGIISNHNGFMEVESEIGKGTTFKIYLPVRNVS